MLAMIMFMIIVLINIVIAIIISIIAVLRGFYISCLKRYINRFEVLQRKP